MSYSKSTGRIRCPNQHQLGQQQQSQSDGGVTNEQSTGKENGDANITDIDQNDEVQNKDIGASEQTTNGEHVSEQREEGQQTNTIHNTQHAEPPSNGWIEQMTNQLASTTTQQFYQQQKYYETKLRAQQEQHQRELDEMRTLNERLQNELNYEKDLNIEKEVEISNMRTEIDGLRVELGRK